MEHSFIKNFRELDIPKKQAWLGMLFIGVNVVFWSLLTYAFALRATTSWIIAPLLLFGLAWAVIYGLLALFAHKYISYFLYVFIGVLLMVLYGFYDMNFIGVILFTLLLFLGYIRAQRFEEFIADFRPYYIARRFVPIIFTGMAIMLAFVCHSYILKYYTDDPYIPQNVYHVVFVPAEYSLEFLFSGYEAGMTVEEFQGVLVNGFLSRFLPGEQQGQFDTEALPEFFGENVGELTVEEFSLAWLNNSISTMLSPYSEILPALFIFGLFLVFRFLILPFVWLSTGLLLLAIKVLSLYNIITLDEVTTVKELPVLK